MARSNLLEAERVTPTRQIEPARPSLRLVPPPTAGATSLPTPVPLLRIDPESAINCDRCGNLIEHSIDAWTSGPNTVRYQGTLRCPECSGPDEGPHLRLVESEDD